MNVDLITVFNPDDEPLGFKFDGKEYTLAPDDVTEVPRAALGPMLTQVGEYGVSPIPKGTSRKDLDELVKGARDRWLEGTRKWAEDVVLDSSKKNRDRVAAGLQAIEDPEVAQARAWLKKHGFLK